MDFNEPFPTANPLLAAKFRRSAVHSFFSICEPAWWERGSLAYLEQPDRHFEALFHPTKGRRA